MSNDTVLCRLTLMRQANTTVKNQCIKAGQTKFNQNGSHTVILIISLILIVHFLICFNSIELKHIVHGYWQLQCRASPSVQYQL